MLYNYSHLFSLWSRNLLVNLLYSWNLLDSVMGLISNMFFRWLVSFPIHCEIHILPQWFEVLCLYVYLCLVLSFFCCIGVYVSFPKGSLFRFFQLNFGVLPVCWFFCFDHYLFTFIGRWERYFVRANVVKSKVQSFYCLLSVWPLASCFILSVPWFLVCKG